MGTASTPAIRIRPGNDAPVRPERRYVLYWCTSARRTRFNFALQRAVERAQELGRPLLVLEPLRAGYRWACDRFHRFVIEGLRDNAAAYARAQVRYLPYVEPEPGAGRGLLAALATGACVVVGDDYPCFFLPRMLAAAGRQLDVRLELVDGNGLFPLQATSRAFTVAHSFRRHLQYEVAPHLRRLPREEPLRDHGLPALDGLPDGVTERWPAADLASLLADGGLRDLPIDHDVGPVDEEGGAVAAGRRLDTFLGGPFTRYGEDRNDPDADGGSRLSAALHFGHLGAHEVFTRIAAREDWTPDAVDGRKPNGARHGWWQMSAPAESFLDQLLTWRELGFNASAHLPDFESYDSLPDWALETLDEHTPDVRPHLYSLEALARAETSDPVWNAAQRQLLREGVIHNYLRMLWGKLVLSWTATPREAVEHLIELNNRYALDGRDPNSYSGIFWCFGRFDRAWGPERKIFGKVRYMTSASAKRKLRMDDYLTRYGDGQGALFG